MRTVTLVDEQNHEIGTAEIVAAHTGKGQLHRAFSVYVFRRRGQEILIQKRSALKMLWAGIWANTCCSHPFTNEDAITAGTRRLGEELGCNCPLTEGGSFVYRAEDPRGKGVEHEHVTLLIGHADENLQVNANPDEVAEWKWVRVSDLLLDFEAHPAEYAPWFHQGLRQIIRDGQQIPTA